MQNQSSTQNAQEMNYLHKLPHVTFEQLLAFHYDNERIFKEKAAESAQDMKEVREKIKETSEQIKETDRIIRQYREDYEKRQKKLDELIGSWDNNHGSFAEEYFYNSFEAGKQNFFGERFDKISHGLKSGTKKFEDEYDVVMYNGSSIAIVEAKFKAHKNDIPKVLNKAKTFRIFYPEYKDYQIYLGLASLSFYTELEEACIANGIAIIKQVGDKVVICDGHLRVY
jgi:ElaB/YqjD/DUF883 family membrane-anchored ribosome-binding protein